MSGNNKNSENTPNLSHLHISLSQTASSPPTLSLAVTNTHPSSPLTLLTWNTPLDPLALQLGLLEVRAAGAHEPLPLATIKVSRKLPPGADSLVTLAPGESRAQEVVLREPIVPLKRAEGGKVAVVARGVWRAVWMGADVSEDAVARMGEGEAVLSGEWETESVVVEV
ncbi:hypothetical protein MPH_02231 [Macrophomina phaseolina MS6]|uniref:Uncharacterized protein n=1 Tax=Macrophomina phaseolina (strain MS6) TaxID=1126212 RepID=K2S0M5_MACPH|nr:hypothetical protein MPH_02231 [Macrophomina phaseolina MS6]